jgi:hypothetical protein
MIEAVIYFLILGAFVGISAGLFGIGGGLLIVPVLTTLLPQLGIDPAHTVHIAVGSSLATIILTSLSAVHAHHHRGAVDWAIFRFMVPGIMIGALLGAGIASIFDSRGLAGLFGLFEILVGIYLLLSPTPQPRPAEIPRPLMTAASLVIGSISSLLGIGGGTMTVPFLAWNRVRMQQAVATSSACGLPIAITGMTGFIIIGWSQAGLPEFSSGYVYWPAVGLIAASSIVMAPVGALLAHRLPAKPLKKAFAVLLLILGIRMLLTY